MIRLFPKALAYVDIKSMAVNRLILYQLDTKEQQLAC
jgi:hypothetical protein